MAKRFIGGGEIVSDVAPAGSVQAFAGAEAPYGWLLCDGSVLNTSDYPKLSAALNGAWDSFAHPKDGTPTVGAGQFALPNMKGLYLAGAGDANTEVRNLGQFQAQKTATNGVGFKVTNDSGATYSDISPSLAGNGNGASPYAYGGAGSAIDTLRKGSPYVSTENNYLRLDSNDAETRPVTAPVNYIIKY